ncbi:carboxy terminal-processing peptidase [Umboniibacter marinipuniceus]|uniref:Carboxyl-terminal processing protease n=1 Tax=Umboniibacter marinipuniceus TaxID=569599 RepID=A0A3M0A872_9GAMM|nr:carboxy terminal-processing peptidase [Umboniibacter marinipuniceus]RMA81283.1 carboxyl-terminal processing protease [Umboniibacter marinipuniceus]
MIKGSFKPIALALVVSGLSVGTATAYEQNVFEFSPVEQETLQDIAGMLESEHYSRQTLNDAYSERWYELYLKSLDPSRLFFLQSDIDEFEQFRFTLDDHTLEGSLRPLEYINARYNQRTFERYEAIQVLLANGVEVFDFSQDEALARDRSEASWPEDMNEADDLWRRYLKNAALSLKLAGKEPAAATETLQKRYDNQARRLSQLNAGDAFDQYANALTLAYDPHSSYLSPRALENFEISMRLQLEGIGAVLQQDGEYTKIVSLVNNGPADKEGNLSPADRIVGVGQGDSPIEDVIGWRLDDVVDLVRGDSGSTVRLEVLKRGSDDLSSTVEVAIVREAVQLEESAASGEVHDVWDGERIRKVGVITIPKFYMDMEAYRNRDPNFRSTANDVFDILREMEAERVEGIVIDLRNNGGGALIEADRLTDLFIDPGVVVQIRYGDTRVSRQHRARHPMIYSGPLVVMTNRLSASASEIFAGAIMDYQRGIVVGTPTFGKGTVQSIESFDGGALKVTESMFYRVNGQSTQFDGVVPHIQFPLQYDPSDIGESAYPYALAWEPIHAVDHNVWIDTDRYVPVLTAEHRARTSDDGDFNYLRERYDWMQTQGLQSEITLNYDQRLREKEEFEASALAIENNRRALKGQDLLTSLDELDDANDEELDVDLEVSESDEENSPPDFILDESTYILVDLINLTRSENIGRWVQRDD